MSTSILCSTLLLMTPVDGSTAAGASPGAVPVVPAGEELVLFRTVPVPFEGQGQVTVFRQGVLHFTVNPGVTSTDGASGASQETVSIRLASTRTLGLVLAKGQWRVEAIDSKLDAERILPLDAAPVLDGPLDGLLRLRGALFAGPYDAKGTWLFEVVDLESGEAFAFLYSPDLRDVVGQIQGESLLLAAECSSGKCEGGSCTIRCNSPYLCAAGCVNGKPTCDCISPLPPNPVPTPLPIPR